MNAEKLRGDFPVLDGNSLVYLDSACMSLKPRQVIEKMNEYYEDYPACGGRSGHKLAARVDEEVSKARKKAARFLNARENEIVFTRNSTEGINIVANGLGLSEKDSVVLSAKEHNSNLVPWLIKKETKGVKVKIVGLKGDNTVDGEKFAEAAEGASVVSMVFTSNLDGTTINAREFAKIAHENNAVVLLDAAQTAPHQKIDVKKLGVAFLVFSGHKLCAPNATGVLFGRQELLEELFSLFAGGETVIDSTYSSFRREAVPQRFEYGLLNYSGIIGLGAAIDYISAIGLEKIEKHCVELNKAATERLLEKQGLRIIGPKEASRRSSILNLFAGNRFHELALFLSESSGIAVRSGQHCCHSWFNAHSMEGSLRASFYLYNTLEEADFFAEKLLEAIEVVGG
jgi:cysteine desulfurase/selenocysteine lyase